MKLVVGLGNPGVEYEKTRHNAGRILVSILEKKLEDKKIKFITPDTFMNNSGPAVAKALAGKKALKDLIVIYDDIDLPSGKIKKPKGEKAVLNFLLGDFKKSELETLKKLSKKVGEAVEMIFTESKEKAMSLYN